MGQAATRPPALVVLSHKPEGATQTIAWVGKGIVYDTGGLSIKTKVGNSLFSSFTLRPNLKSQCQIKFAQIPLGFELSRVLRLTCYPVFYAPYSLMLCAGDL